MSAQDVRGALRRFGIEGGAAPYGGGHINDTFLTDGSPGYILQRVNTGVFKEPERLMDNIAAVTEHLRRKIAAQGGDPNRETLTLVRTTDGAGFYKTDGGDYYRVYLSIERAKTWQTAERPGLFGSSAKALGRFQKLLSDFPAGNLHETIPDFHNTRARFAQLQRAIADDAAGRLGAVQAEVQFAMAREGVCGTVVDAMAKGDVPARVTHNDTKLNNFLFDEGTGEAICVIDLDTVMPGSLLYDFGDSIRFGANAAAEDEVDLSKVSLDLTLFEEFAGGFLSEMADRMTPKEIELLPFSAVLLTLECGMRFLADYLNGDTYFKIHRPNHNLDRCRAQFRLAEDMERKTGAMAEIVAKACHPTPRV